MSVYQYAMASAKQVYHLTCLLPVQQKFVLTAQLRRSIVMVCTRLSAVAFSDNKERLKRNSELFIRVYAELKTQIKMSLTLGHFQAPQLQPLEATLDQILLYCENNLQPR